MTAKVFEETFTKAFFYAVVGIMVLFLAVIGVATAQDNTADSGPGAIIVNSPGTQSKVIYVQDFALDTTSTGAQNESGSPPGTSSKQAARSQKLVDLMSKSLVAELNKAGFTAHRVSSDEKPSAGLLLTGTFMNVEQGSAARRAFVGFGSGAAHVELCAKLVDIAQTNDSLYEFSLNQSSGKKPGAVITPSPVIAGVKFVLTKNAPEKIVKKGAHQIAIEMAKQLNSDRAIASN